MIEQEPVHVGLCTGPDCRKHKKRIRRLERYLDGVCTWDHVACQDLCKGPVARVTRGEKTFLLKKIRGKKLARDLVTYLTEGKLSRPLKKRRKKLKRKPSVKVSSTPATT